MSDEPLKQVFNDVSWTHQHDPQHSAICALNDVDVKAGLKSLPATSQIRGAATSPGCGKGHGATALP
jgi:hypothetical protein